MPQDNHSLLGLGLRGLLIEANVAANGRWGCLGMAAIALHQGRLFLAFCFVLALLIAYLVEMISERSPARVICAVALTIWVGMCLVVLGAGILWP